MAERLLGKQVNAALNASITERADELRRKGIAPKLAIIRVGEREDDLSYERGAMKRCQTLHVDVTNYVLPANVGQDELEQTIRMVNEDAAIHGVLLFRPLPKHLDENRIISMLDPKKDVDGITEGSMAGVFSGNGTGYPPCTAQACMEILDHYGIDCTGKKAVVIGRSMVIGKPAAMMLLQKNATVTICHTRTKRMEEITKDADILLVAAGRARVVDESFVSEGQIVLDVGIHVKEDGGLCGDVAYDKVEGIVKAITPVPGGVGGVTTSVLIEHVVSAAEKVLG